MLPYKYIYKENEINPIFLEVHGKFLESEPNTFMEQLIIKNQKANEIGKTFMM